MSIININILYIYIYISISISLNFNYTQYKVNKIIILIYLPKNMIVNKQKVLILIYTFTLMNILLCIQFIF